MGDAYTAFASARKKPHEGITSVLHQANIVSLLSSPETLLVMLNIWHADHLERSKADTDNLERSDAVDPLKSKNTVYTKALELLKLQLTKEKLEAIQIPQLLEYVRASASADSNVSKPASDLLKLYFETPRKDSEFIAARRRLAFVALDLLNDPVALKKALEIGTFQTDIMKSEGYVLAFFVATRLGIDDNLQNNDYQLRDAWNTNMVFQKLYDFCGLDDHNASGIENRYLKSQEFDTKLKLLTLNAQRANQNQREFHSRVAKLDTVGKDSIFATSAEGPVIKLEWPINVILNLSDPLRRLYTERVEPLIYARDMISGTKEMFLKATPGVDPRSVTIRIPGTNFIADIVVQDAAMLEHLNKIIAHVQQNAASLDEDIIRQLQQDNIGGVKMSHPIRAGLKPGQLFEYWFRQSAVSERALHSIAELEQIGLPKLKLPENQTLAEYAERYTRSVAARRSVFFGPKGARGNITQKELKDLGYDHISFNNHPDDATRTVVTIYVGKGKNAIGYEVTLDKDLHIETDGLIAESPNTPDFVRSLQVTILAMIENTICHEMSDDSPRTPNPQHVQNVLRAVGHLRFLPIGFHASQKAAANFANEVRADISLATVSNMRRRAFEAIYGLDSRRDSTYVRRRGEQTKRLLIRLSNVLFMK